MRIFPVVVLACTLGVPSWAVAQSPPERQQGVAGSQAAQSRPRNPSARPAGDAPLPTPEELGISLARIRKDLREVAPTKSNLLRYDFRVDVYGSRPKVDFFKDFDLSPNGAVRYGGMTHAEFMNVVTPQAFRAPSADLLGVAMMAVQQLMKRGGDGAKPPDK